MSTSSRSSRAVLVLMVAVVLVLVTGPEMVAAAWCPRTGDQCGPKWWCCDCDPNNGGRKLHCGEWSWDTGLVCAVQDFERPCYNCGSDGVCYASSTLEGTVREALGLPRKLSMKK